MRVTKDIDTLTDEMVSATEFIEAAAREWQADNPEASPACFLMASAKFIADSFASVGDETFEAMLQKMRDERRDWQRRGVRRKDVEAL